MAAEIPVRPAATVLLLRDRPEGGVEVHLQQRRAEMDFGGRAYVFPGGAVDAADASDAVLGPLRDVDLGATPGRMGLDADGDALRACRALHVSAVREVLEEAGLLLAVDPEGRRSPPPEGLGAVRTRLLEGGDLGAELGSLGLRAHIETLVYVAHFITPVGVSRRYDTRFFATRTPEGQVADFHTGEATASGWFTAREMLDLNDRGEAVLMPPTRILLTELARHADVDAVLGDLGTRPVASILFTMADLSLPLPDHLPTVAEVAALRASRA